MRRGNEHDIDKGKDYEKNFADWLTFYVLFLFTRTGNGLSRELTEKQAARSPRAY